LSWVWRGGERLLGKAILNTKKKRVTAVQNVYCLGYRLRIPTAPLTYAIALGGGMPVKVQ